MHDLCRHIGVPTPEVYARSSGPTPCCAACRELLGDRGDFVVKPNRGSAGRGVLVLIGRDGERYLRHNGERLALDQLRQHLSDILSGMYSLGGQPDEAIVQQRIRLHPAFEAITYKGIPDVRVILYRNEPAMAMLRLPTKESNGRANLHQGGIGTGVDLDTGITHHAVQRNRFVDCHPDTGHARRRHARAVLGRGAATCRGAWREAVGLGYIGVDIVVDADEGPMLLEANARPGLAIQIANGRGLLPRLEAIDAQLSQAQEESDEEPIERRTALRRSA